MNTDNKGLKRAKANTVAASNQLKREGYVTVTNGENDSLKVLFVGNSITRHAPKVDIGWDGDWGMAASGAERDYVHQVVRRLEKRYGAVSYCIAQASEWESNFIAGDTILPKYYQEARDFAADIVIIRLGENLNREMDQKTSFQPYFDRMIRFFASNPKAVILVTDTFWKMEIFSERIREVIAENGYIYCGLSDLEEDERTMALGLFAHGGVAVHPGDYGMQCIAKRIIAALPTIEAP